MAKKKIDDSFDALFSEAVDAVSNAEGQEMEIEIEVVEETPSRARRGRSFATEDDLDIDLDAELAALGEPAQEQDDAPGRV